MRVPKASSCAKGLFLVAISFFSWERVLAQRPASAVSVNLVATLPESVTVRHGFFPLAQAYGPEHRHVFGLLHTVVYWRLREGQAMQLHFSPPNDLGDDRQYSGNPFGHVRDLASVFRLFPSPDQGQAVLRLTGAGAKGAERPVGWTSLITGVSCRRPSDACVLTISVAIL